MAAPTDTTPLRRAVVHALTQATGKPRSLGLDGHPLFREVGPSEGQGRTAAAIDKPVVHVVVRDHAPEPGSLMLEMSTTRREVCTVVVTCTYASGNPAERSEIDRTLAVIERDRQRVIAALCYPGALELDPDGNDTGLDSYCLRLDGYSSAGPDPWPMPSKSPHVLRVVHRFRQSVELTQPSAT